MGIGTLGFLSGFSKTALSGIQEREEADRQEKRDRLLAKLQQENAIKLKQMDIDDADAKIDEKLSVVDYASGKVILKSAKGKVLGERPITQAEQAEQDFTEKSRKLSLDKVSTDIAKTQNDITNDNSRTAALNAASYANARQSDASAGAERARAKSYSLDSAAAGGGSLDERASEKIYKLDKTLESLEKQGLPRAVAEQTVREAMLQAAALQRNGQAVSVDTLINDALQRQLAKAKKPETSWRMPRK